MLMCGRFGLHHTWQTTSHFLYEHFQVEFNESMLTLPQYNIAPTQSVITLIHDGDKFRGGLTKWGFSLGPNSTKPVINARSESVYEKSFFRNALRSKRCLILASGFYEWKREGSSSQPFWFYDSKQPFLVFAGLYQTLINHQGNKETRSAMLTTAANDVMAPIHNRIPVMLNPDQYRHWVHPHTSIDEFNFLFKSANHPHLACYPISPYVNKIDHNDAQCIQPIALDTK